VAGGSEHRVARCDAHASVEFYALDAGAQHAVLDEVEEGDELREDDRLRRAVALAHGVHLLHQRLDLRRRLQRREEGLRL